MRSRLSSSDQPWLTWVALQIVHHPGQMMELLGEQGWGTWAGPAQLWCYPRHCLHTAATRTAPALTTRLQGLVRNPVLVLLGENDSLGRCMTTETYRIYIRVYKHTHTNIYIQHFFHIYVYRFGKKPPVTYCSIVHNTAQGKEILFVF